MSRPDHPPLVHPSAVVSAEAVLGPGVRVGPLAVIDGPVTLGPGCVVRPHAHLIGPLTLGPDNDVGTGCVLGDRPQHLGYKGEETRVEVGSGNTFREHVTVHRGMPVGTGPGTGVTRIGSRNLFMVNSHVGHDAEVGDDCVMANGVLLAGHVRVGDRALLSGNAAIHQFTRIGRMALVSGVSGVSQDVPPFWVTQGYNTACGVNVVGMRRGGVPSVEIQAVRRAFNIIYRGGLILSLAVTRVERELGHLPAVRELVDFVRASKRGVCGGHRHIHGGTAEAA